MRYLVATDSVHTSAAACDYLEPRLDPADIVVLLTVVAPNDGPEPGAARATPTSDRDAGDAANVATARLAGLATVEPISREGDPSETIRSVAADRTPDVVLVGVHGGRPGAGPGMGSVARAVVERSGCPVVVLPLESLDA